MNGYILGLATAVPLEAISQEQALEKNMQMFAMDEEQKESVKKLYQNSGIEKRHIVVSDFKSDRTKWHFWGSDYPKSIPGMAARNAVYKKEAPLLAHQAAEKALLAWGGDPQAITHVIAISCTGMVIPGVEFSLINSLGLNRSVCRLGINFMGCFGAFKGLQVAHAFAKENANNRILVVCVELCSLHLQATLDQDTILANSIFGDGAAAAVIGSTLKASENPLWEMVQHHSFGLEDSLSQMSWEAGDYGFLMKLSGFVPLSIAKNIKSFASELLKSHELCVSACDWAIHPGGKLILQVIEKKLALESNQTEASWNTLAKYGNMSSATFLFVLEHLSKQANLKKWAAGIGFGPGLSMEGILLRAMR